MRILLVEDHLATASGLKFLLEREGFLVELATDWASARERFSEHLYNLVLLDVNLPGKNGFDIAKEFRSEAKDIPLIFLTARDDEESVVRGFNLSADDYITKPFRSRELISRIRAALRRRHAEADVITCGNLTLDENAHVLRKSDVSSPTPTVSTPATSTALSSAASSEATSATSAPEISLSPLEYKILRLFMLNSGSIVSRERLLDEIWDYAGNIVNDNTLTVHIKRLRQKVGESTIQTVKGLGYKMEAK